MPPGYALVITGLSQPGDISYDGVEEAWDMQPLSSECIGVPAAAFWALARPVTEAVAAMAKSERILAV